MSVLEVFSSTIGVIVAVRSSLSGQGVLSIIWGMLMKTTISSISLLFIGWKNNWLLKFRFNFNYLKGYVVFGSYQLGEKSINYFHQRFGHLIIGYVLGAQILGYFYLAFNLAIIPFQKLNGVLTRVSFPLFATVQKDNAKLRYGYLFILKLLSMINIPALMGLIVTAQVLMPLLFGVQWE